MSPTAASRRPARRTRLTAAAIATPLALGAVLTGCSSGQITQTAEKRPAVEGAHGEVGDIMVHNAQFVAPGEEGKYEAGDTVPFDFVVTSSGSADEITDITVDGEEAPISGADGATSIEIPAGGIVVVGEDGDFSVEATMPEEIYPATLLPVVITFEEAGDLAFEVPVAAPLEEVDRDPDETWTPEEEEGGH